MVERALQMTEACIADLLHAKPADSNVKLEVDDFLSHIYLLRVHNPTEQLAVINTLPKLLNDHQQVRHKQNSIIWGTLNILYYLGGN